MVANETKAVVLTEETEATAKAERTQEIADSAQKDLDEALPALDAALASLKSLNKNDVVEVCLIIGAVPLLHPPPRCELCSTLQWACGWS